MDIKSNTKVKRGLFFLLSSTIQQQFNFKLFWLFKSFDEMEGKVCLSSNMVNLFNGEGDLIAWLVKVKLVAGLQKVHDL